MLRRSLLVLTGLVWALTGNAQTFLKVIGDPGRAEAGFVSHVSTSGGIYIAGSVNDSALVQRIDGDGAVLWSRAFRPTGQWPKVVYHLADTPEGDIIGCGSGLDATQQQVEGFHFRMDATGNLIWLRSWDNPTMYERRIMVVNAGEYMVIGGISEPFPFTYSDVMNARIDAATGNVIALSDRYDLYSPNSYVDEVRAGLRHNDKFYTVSGMSVNGPPVQGRRVGLSSYDLLGNFIDNNYLVFSDFQDRRVYPTDVVMKDDSLTIAYYGDINGSSTTWTAGLIRCDTLGNVAWARDFNIGGSGQEHGTRLLSTSFGYVLAGRTSTSTPNKLFLMGISTSGTMLWCRTYGDPVQAHSLVDFYAHNVADLGDGFLLTGMVDQGAGDLDLLLIRTDVDGQITCDVVTDRNAITTVLPTFNFPTAALLFPFPVATDQSAPIAVDAGIVDLCEVEVDLGNDTAVCGVLTLDAGIPNAVYEWQDGSTGQTLDVNGSGTYWVRVNLGCCIGSDTIVVTAGEIDGIDLGPDTAICEGAQLSLEPLTGTWTFTWSDGSTDPTLLVSDAGTYWVEAIDGDCSAQDTIEVSLAALPTVLLGPDTASCTGDPIEIIPEVTDVLDYLWTGGSTDATFIVEGSGTVTLEVSNACGSATDEITVTIIDGQTVDLGPDTIICDGETIQLSVDLPGWDLTWSDGSTASTFMVSAAGDYWVDVELSGCTDTDSITVLGRSLPQVTLPSDTSLCLGEVLELDPVLVDVDELIWSDGSDTPTLLVGVDGTYSITVTNTCGTATDDITASFVEPLSVGLGPDTTLCGTDSLVLDLTATGAILEWQDGSTDPVFVVHEPGHYWVTADVDGCVDRDTVDVDYDQLAQLDLDGDRTLCTISSYTLDAGFQGNDAVWQDGTIGRTYVAEATGRYIATITNYCGAAADTVQLNFAVRVDELPDIELCAAEQVTLDPEGDLVEVRWTTGDTADAITVGEGDYGYEATDIYGCAHADFVRIRWLEESDGQIMIPLAFTPNGDDLNEEFLVHGAEEGAFELVLFNRWGAEIYRTDDPYKSWDGTSGGEPVPDGVYVYTVTYQDRCNANSTLITTRGHVSVLR
ncbi:MAG: gliding motility-associated C-terminal domain-containing protein [Flavobacteriales bacterium]|nr:gliding motility-associated C-terminal domain-containing protein [Flavobacteriales bacterium]